MTGDAVVLRRTGSRARAEEWALVLSAEGLSPMLRPQDGAFALCLPAAQAERGLAALAAYERENPPEPEPEAPEEPEPRSASAGTYAALSLVLFFLITGPRAPGNPWFEAGSADAGRILAGEYWRTATALTLHADLGHVAGNAFLGAILVNAVCGLLGSGVGLAAVLLAGIGGNALNALFHVSSHSSVGASTAVFGALGVLCGPALSRRHRSGLRGRRLMAPLAAGLGLIAMLGVGGERTDLWAHLLGFAVGAGLGLPLVFLRRRRPGAALQGLCGALVLLVLFWSWGTALEW